MLVKRTRSAISDYLSARPSERLRLPWEDTAQLFVEQRL
jgi:hypothetical protein